MLKKSLIRERGKRLRAAMGGRERAECDQQILAQCRAGLDWAGCRRVMVFLPIERHLEVDTWPLLRWIWETHPEVRVYAPRMDGDELVAVLVSPESAFKVGAWGVPESVSGPLLKVDERLDLVLTPLLGFDAQGHRVGYGRGYYDRFFSTHPEGRRVGLGYECLFVNEGIAAEEHDVRLQVVITEQRVYEFS